VTNNCTECARSFPNEVMPIRGHVLNEAQCLFCAIRLNRILNSPRKDSASSNPSKVA
jgi:hypothetical protein